MEQETVMSAAAAERTERERKALAEVSAAKEKAAEQLRVEATLLKAKKEEDRKLQEEKAKAKAARAAEAAEAAAAVREQADRERKLAREQRAREAAASAAKRRSLLPSSTVTPPEPSTDLPVAMHLRGNSLESNQLSASPEALLAADIPRIGLQHPALPLAEFAVQPAPRQYLRDAVGPAVTASLVRLACASNSIRDHKARETFMSTPSKGVTTFLSRSLLSPPGLEDAHAEAEATRELSESGVRGESWRATMRPLLQNALAQLDLERPHEESSAVEFVARTLRSMEA